MNTEYSCIYFEKDGKCRKFSDDTYISYCVMGPCPEHLEQLQAENDRLKGEVQKMRWIPVEERLPSVNDLVLVFSKDDEYGHTQHELAKYMFHPTLGWDWCTFDNEYYEWLPAFNRVTHWMPLPTLPKEENRESV